MRMRWIVGMAVAVVLAACGPVATTVTSAKPKVPVLVITIGGTGPAASITLHIDNRRSRRVGPVALPYVFTDTRLDDIDGAYPVTVEAKDASASPDARMTCLIVESGVDVAHETVEGPHRVARCSDNQPQNPLHPAGTTVRSPSARRP